jgi:PAS domain S-box-containing protein
MQKAETILYLISLVLQMAAVVFALRMVRRSALRAPWFAMATALSVMTAFRLVGLLSAGDPPVWPLREGMFRAMSAWASPFISLLLFLSLFAIRRLSLVQESAVEARLAAEESLRSSDLRLRAIFHQTTGFLGILSPDGTLLDVNPAPLAASGLTREQVVGMPFWETAWFARSPEVVAGLRAAIQDAAVRGQSTRYESNYFAADGSPRATDRLVTPIKDADGRVVYVIVESRDITDRKQAEEALLRAKQEAESASAAKDQFLAVLSHELRTPLTPVLLTVSELEKDPALSPALRDDVSMIRRNVEMEARLIDDLLDLTRITRGKMQLNVERADVHVLIRGAVEICRGGDGRGPGTTLRLGAVRRYVSGDPARLQQVFWNLLNNAKKFTPPDGRIEVVTSDAAADGRVRVEVIDSGVGIEAELLPKVFHAFEQGEARRYGGLGLGLAICKALVEMHDGTIEAQSDGKGRGARFVIELPAVAAETAGDQPIDGPESIGLPGPLRILLVEDHLETSKVMSKLLSGMGHDVTAAGTAAEAERAWLDATFDLVISDLGLPDASGHELLGRLKGHRPVRGIAISGFGMAEDVRKSADAGFLAHVTKPLNSKRLRAAIEGAFADGLAERAER